MIIDVTALLKVDDPSTGFNVEPGAPVEVRDSDGNLAIIYSDEAFTAPISQPANCDANGQFLCYAPDGEYSVKITYSTGIVSRSVGVNLKSEFDTVNDAVNYSGVPGLIGKRVWLSDRKAWFKVVLSSTVTPNGIGEIVSSANASYSFQIEDKGNLYAHQLGFSSGDFADLQPILDYCMASQLNLKVERGDYTMSTGEIRWNPTIEVDFCGSYVLCALGAKITHKYISSDAGSTNSYNGYRCYFKNLRIEGAGKSVAGSNVWSQGNTSALPGGKDFARCKTQNIQVLECNPALEINTFNTYLVENESCMLERGDTLIQVNDGGVNSGENFKFTGNGIFAVCNDVLVLNESCDISFIGSSFDFIQNNTVVFNSGYCYIKHIGCYYEKATKYGIARATGSYFNTVVMITDPIILAREYNGYNKAANAGNNKLFTGQNITYKCDGLRIKRELYNADPTDYDLCADDIKQIKLTNVMRDQFSGQCLGPKFSANLNSNFELSNNGDGIATTGVTGFVDSNIASGYAWTVQNSTFYSGSKAIEATLDGVATTFCDILTTRINCNPNEGLVIAAKLNGGISSGNIRVDSTVRFYDVNDNVINTVTLVNGDMNDYYTDTTSPLYTGARNYWIGIPSTEVNSVPNGAAYCDVKITISQFTGQVYVDDFCVNVY